MSIMQFYPRPSVLLTSKSFVSCANFEQTVTPPDCHRWNGLDSSRNPEQSELKPRRTLRHGEFNETIRMQYLSWWPMATCCSHLKKQPWIGSFFSVSPWTPWLENSFGCGYAALGYPCNPWFLSRNSSRRAKKLTVCTTDDLARPPAGTIESSRLTTSCCETISLASFFHIEH